MIYNISNAFKKLRTDILKKISKILKRKEFVFLAIIFLVVLVYILFFKPNPKIRLNYNKILGTAPSSALYIDGPDEVDGTGKSFSVKIQLDTKDNFVNAVQSYLIFDNNVLEVVKTDTTNSFCRFYPENIYSNTGSFVKLSCGAPYPGFRGTNTIQIIEFYAKAIKETEIFFSGESMVLANDGKGTNLLTDLPIKKIKIKAGL